MVVPFLLVITLSRCDQTCYLRTAPTRRAAPPPPLNQIVGRARNPHGPQNHYHTSSAAAAKGSTIHTRQPPRIRPHVARRRVSHRRVKPGAEAIGRLTKRSGDVCTASDNVRGRGDRAAARSAARAAHGSRHSQPINKRNAQPSAASNDRRRRVSSDLRDLRPPRSVTVIGVLVESLTDAPPRMPYEFPHCARRAAIAFADVKQPIVAWPVAAASAEPAVQSAAGPDTATTAARAVAAGLIWHWARTRAASSSWHRSAAREPPYCQAAIVVARFRVARSQLRCGRPRQRSFERAADEAAARTRSQRRCT